MKKEKNAKQSSAISLDCRANIKMTTKNSTHSRKKKTNVRQLHALHTQKKEDKINEQQQLLPRMSSVQSQLNVDVYEVRERKKNYDRKWNRLITNHQVPSARFVNCIQIVCVCCVLCAHWTVSWMCLCLLGSHSKHMHKTMLCVPNFTVSIICV